MEENASFDFNKCTNFDKKKYYVFRRLSLYTDYKSIIRSYKEIGNKYATHQSIEIVEMTTIWFGIITDLI